MEVQAENVVDWWDDVEEDRKSRDGDPKHQIDGSGGKLHKRPRSYMDQRNLVLIIIGNSYSYLNFALSNSNVKLLYPWANKGLTRASKNC